jgi:hypothetical protein
LIYYAYEQSGFKNKGKKQFLPAGRRFLAMIPGVILFAVIIAIISLLIYRRYEKTERTELATY